jgi:hypothetical protein
VDEMAFGISWLKPEIDKPIYYLHLGIVAAVALGILQLWQGGDMFSLQNILYSIPILLAGDIVAHTILKLN